MKSELNKEMKMAAYIIDTDNGRVERVMSSVVNARRALNTIIRKNAESSYPSKMPSRLAVATEAEYVERWQPYSSELIDTVNCLTGKPLKIARLWKGTHLDPATESYHSM
jgi:hypothetical protein